MKLIFLCFSLSLFIQCTGLEVPFGGRQLNIELRFLIGSGIVTLCDQSQSPLFSVLLE